jgi:hypothetical protein
MISLFRVYFYMIAFQVCAHHQRLTFAWMTLGITIQFSITLFQLVILNSDDYQIPWISR